MKTLFRISNLCVILFLTTALQAQVAIGKATVDGSGIMDFGSQNMGIILPWVNTATTTSITNGTLIFDTSDYKVKYLKDGVWTDLSERTFVGSTAAIDIKIAAHNAKEEDGANAVDIGTTNLSTIKGVLVLEATDKALILPKMASPHLNMNSPEAGTIVYDTVTKLMCVYNGEEWTFWSN